AIARCGAARNRDIPRCFDSKENSGRRWLDNKNIQIVETIRIHAPDMCCNFGFRVSNDPDQCVLKLWAVNRVICAALPAISITNTAADAFAFD
ncbi:TPA: hypothetical protein QDB07_002112, partial [Burkholderia vietnamiensis]|nr:hypothetical protein [Burkholderia vietnamiensis]